MNTTNWDQLEQQTRDHLGSIVSGRNEERGLTLYRCGCETRKGTIRLCPFHEGMDYGLEVAGGLEGRSECAHCHDDPPRGHTCPACGSTALGTSTGTRQP
jgi:hypothetical protein